MVNRLFNHGNQLNAEFQQIYQLLNQLVAKQQVGGSSTSSTGVTKENLQALNVAFLDEQQTFSAKQIFNNNAEFNSTVNLKSGVIANSSQPFSVNSPFVVTNTASFSSGVTFIGPLSHSSGTATFNSTVNLKSGVIANSSQPFSVNSPFVVTNTASFSSGVTFIGPLSHSNGTATFNGSIVFNNNVDLNGDLDLDGDFLQDTGYSFVVLSPWTLAGSFGFIFSPVTVNDPVTFNNKLNMGISSSLNVRLTNLFLQDGSGNVMNGQTGETFNTNDVLKVITTSPFKFGFRQP